MYLTVCGAAGTATVTGYFVVLPVWVQKWLGTSDFKETGEAEPHVLSQSHDKFDSHPEKISTKDSIKN